MGNEKKPTTEKRLSLEDFKLTKLATDNDISKLLAGNAAAACHLCYGQYTPYTLVSD